MAEGHKIYESQGYLFAAGGCHSCLWLEATRSNASQVLAIKGTDGHTIHIANVAFPRLFSVKLARFGVKLAR